MCDFRDTFVTLSRTGDCHRIGEPSADTSFADIDEQLGAANESTDDAG
jgi:hypothetical protein